HQRGEQEDERFDPGGHEQQERREGQDGGDQSDVHDVLATPLVAQPGDGEGHEELHEGGDGHGVQDQLLAEADRLADRVGGGEGGGQVVAAGGDRKQADAEQDRQPVHAQRKRDGGGLLAPGDLGLEDGRLLDPVADPESDADEHDGGDERDAPSAVHDERVAAAA